MGRSASRSCDVRETSRKPRAAVPLLACLAFLTACGGGGGGGFATTGGPRAPSAPNPVALEFRSQTLPAPAAASTAVDYRTAEYTSYWGLENIGARHAYARGYFGQGVTIAVADDGMDLTHPDLAVTGKIVSPRRLVGAGGSPDALVTENEPATVHGTYVAMIAAGARGNTVGTFQVTMDSGSPIATKNVQGVAPQARIMPIETSNSGRVSAAIRWAADNGAHVINFSIGTPQLYWGTYDGRPGVWLTQALPYFSPLLRRDSYITGQFAAAANILRNKDVVAVWAASNDGWNSIKNSIDLCGKNSRTEGGCRLLSREGGAYGESVSATDFMSKFRRNGDTDPDAVTFDEEWGSDGVDYDSGGGWAEAPLFQPRLLGKWLVVGALNQSGAIASFSNGCGAARNWCLVAPGENLALLPGPGGGLGGTSFAAPMVSGALAVLKSRFSSLSMEVVQALLLVSATPMGTRAEPGNANEPDSTYGWGKLNLQNAIAMQGEVSLPYSVVASGTTLGVPLARARAVLSPALSHAGARMRAVEVAAGSLRDAYWNMKLAGLVDVEAPPPSRALGRAAGDMLAPAGGERVGNALVFADLDRDARALSAVGMDLPSGAFGRWRLGLGLRDSRETSAWREWDAFRADGSVSSPFFDRAGGAGSVVLQRRGDSLRPFAAFSGRASRRTPWRQFGLQWGWERDGFDLMAEVSRIDESRSVWGSTFGAFGSARTETRREKLHLSAPLGRHWSAFAGYERNSARVSAGGDMLAGVSGLRAEGWTAGFRGAGALRDGDALRFSVGRETQIGAGEIRLDHLVATGSDFAEAFYLGRPQSLERRQTAIDLRAEPKTRWSLGYALPVREGARLAFGVEVEDGGGRGLSTQLRMSF